VKAEFLLILWAGGAAAGQPTCEMAGSTTLHIEMCWADYYADIYAVPREFVGAIIDVESGWHPYAVSPKGAAGLMQLMPGTAVALGVTNRFQSEQNIRAGVAYLAYLSRAFRGELRLVAAAYYAGERRIRQHGLQTANPDVIRYVSTVQRCYRNRQKVNGLSPEPKR
jgi:soluble lytic murein transglycosylase